MFFRRKQRKCSLVDRKTSKLEMVDDGEHTIVIDNGSAFIRAGFAGRAEPGLILASIVGRSTNKDGGESFLENEQIYIGDEALARKETLSVNMPIQQRLITNWDDMEKLWHHIFYNELKVAPEEIHVLLTEPPLNPKAKREKMTQIMFETFHVLGFYVGIQACLALYASGRTTGVILDSGDGVTHSVAIYEGYSLPHATLKLDIGGRDLTDYMRQLLIEKGSLFDGMDQRKIAEDIKEKLCYVAQDFDFEMKNQDSSNFDVSYELPNKEIINIGNEILRCPEILFNPSFVGNDDPGCHDIVFRTVEKCDLDIRRDLFCNIVLCGGSTLFKGFSDRLLKEVVALAQKGYKIYVVASPERLHFAWNGGSIIGSLSTFGGMWISNAEYQAYGPSIVHRKCF